MAKTTVGRTISQRACMKFHWTLEGILRATTELVGGNLWEGMTNRPTIYKKKSNIEDLVALLGECGRLFKIF